MGLLVNFFPYRVLFLQIILGHHGVQKVRLLACMSPTIKASNEKGTKGLFKEALMALKNLHFLKSFRPENPVLPGSI